MEQILFPILALVLGIPMGGFGVYFIGIKEKILKPR
jgi:hypothetical protein